MAMVWHGIQLLQQIRVIVWVRYGMCGTYMNKGIAASNSVERLWIKGWTPRGGSLLNRQIARGVRSLDMQKCATFCNFGNTNPKEGT